MLIYLVDVTQDVTDWARFLIDFKAIFNVRLEGMKEIKNNEETYVCNDLENHVTS